MEATSFYFQGKRVYADDDVPKSTIYTLDTNDIRITPMKNDWSEIEAELDLLNRELERSEPLVWLLSAAVLGAVVALAVMIGWSWLIN